MKPTLTLLAALLLAPLASGAQLTPVPTQQVVIDDAFWSPKIKTWREVTIPDCLAKFEKDGTLLNFDRVRDGQLKEKHNGPPWYDGLLYEMIRGCADYLAAQRDPALEQRLDGYIERIVAAQAKDPNGYVNTYTQMHAADASLWLERRRRQLAARCLQRRRDVRGGRALLPRHRQDFAVESSRALGQPHVRPHRPAAEEQRDSRPRRSRRGHRAAV